MPNCQICGKFLKKLGSHTVEYCKNRQSTQTVLTLSSKTSSPNTTQTTAPHSLLSNVSNTNSTSQPETQITSSLSSSSKCSKNIVNKPFKCLYCDKMYSYEKSRTNHEENCHKNPSAGSSLCSKASNNNKINSFETVSSIQKTDNSTNLDDKLCFSFDDLFDEPEFDPDLEEQIFNDLNNLKSSKNALNYFEKIEKFSDRSKFNILHLNVNSIQHKLSQIEPILI